jgi:uncharacterized membrane protein YkvA (DUF1232 family)
MAQRGLRSVQSETESLADHPGRLRALARRAQARLTHPRSRLGSLRDDVPGLIRLVRAYAAGEYRRLPWKSVMLVVGALVYFVTPLDLIPDILIGTGFLDDAVVVAYVLKAIRDDLARFADWEATRRLDDPDTLSPPY